MTLTVSQIRSLIVAGELTEAEGQEMIAERVAALNTTAGGAAAKTTTKTTAKKSETVAAPPTEKKTSSKTSTAKTSTKKPSAKKESEPKEKKTPVPANERPPFLTIDGAEEIDKYCPRQIVFMGFYGDLGLPSFKIGKAFLTYSPDVWGHMNGPSVFGGSRFAEFAEAAIAGTWDNETQSVIE